MRKPALAILLLTASCGQGDRGPNQVSEGGPSRTADAPARGPTIAIAASGCAATWDGQAVTPAQIAERGGAMMRQAVTAAGGPQNVDFDTLPIPAVEAPADMRFGCADTILFALQRGGVFSVTLRPLRGEAEPGGQAPVLMDFAVETGAPPPVMPMVLGVGAGGPTWNSSPVNATQLAAQLGQMGSTAAPASMEDTPPPGYPELRVQPEATFGQLYELLRTTRRYHLRPGIYLPSAGPGPSPVANPAPPMPPMPPMPPPAR
jgi:hypothetical protein